MAIKIEEQLDKIINTINQIERTQSYKHRRDLQKYEARLRKELREYYEHERSKAKPSTN